jgi:hypothetical protein
VPGNSVKEGNCTSWATAMDPFLLHSCNSKFPLSPVVVASGGGVCGQKFPFKFCPLLSFRLANLLIENAA